MQFRKKTTGYATYIYTNQRLNAVQGSGKIHSNNPTWHLVKLRIKVELIYFFSQDFQISESFDLTKASQTLFAIMHR